MTDDAAAERKRLQRERERQLRGDVTVHETKMRDPQPWVDPNPEGWRARAACKDEDVNLFFPGRGEDARPAKAICRPCPVREACLEYAMAQTIADDCGIFGGLSERERRRLRSRRARARRVAS